MNQMIETLIQLDRESVESLQMQIRRQIAIAVVSGRFPPNYALPSIRDFARRLHVSNNTVSLAYDALRQDGFIASKRRSGYFISPDAHAARDAAVMPGADQDPPDRFDFKAHFGDSTYDQPRTTKPHDALVRFRYPFISGHVDPNMFPVGAWRECVRDSVNSIQIRNWAMDFSTVDDPLLIEQLILRVLQPRGIYANPDEVLITVGGQNALYTALKLLLKKRGVLGVENPGYPEAANIARMEGHEVRHLPMDDEGLILSPAALECSCLYVTTTHQHPTTVTMSESRRHAFLRETRKKGIFIIEDDYEAETTFDEKAVPALKALDHYGNVIYIGSLTKSLMPGLRIGFLVADRDFVSEARSFRHHVLRHPPINNQNSVGLFLERGHFDRFIARLRDEYRARARVTRDALYTYLPELKDRARFGGSSCYFSFADGLDTLALQEAAARRSVYFEESSKNFENLHEGRSGMRLGYSCIDKTLIPDGVRLLSEAVAELRGT
ncbi:aminotransferase-like domain-containing protein [Chachezhania sediminis]|uniref:aminotransferase-like domain-containing protein n=1 Tax=Chachezhania sediminis TaxID=2599291 RepID=UPI001E500D63|nr:PLP-dependent aminotransferase family protein [Chachezhania sediminis]